MVHPKKNVSNTWSPSKLRLRVRDAHTKLSDKETRFQSMVLQATAVPTDRTKKMTLYKEKVCYLWNTKQLTHSRNKVIVNIFLVQLHQLQMLISAQADHNHSHNYYIYATVCAMVKCRMLCGNTPGGAQCHWLLVWSFNFFHSPAMQSIPRRFPRHNFQVSIL